MLYKQNEELMIIWKIFQYPIKIQLMRKKPEYEPTFLNLYL